VDVIILAIELCQFRLDLHKASTAISKNHALVCIEDLKVRNMSGSAAGSTDAPGRNVRNKSGLNKSILDQVWNAFRRQLDCKLAWNGGHLIAVPPQNIKPDLPMLRLRRQGIAP
jgi:putative transposase